MALDGVIVPDVVAAVVDWVKVILVILWPTTKLLAVIWDKDLSIVVVPFKVWLLAFIVTFRLEIVNVFVVVPE